MNLFLMDNVGNQTSIRNVAAKLTSGAYKTNDKTVGAYHGITLIPPESIEEGLFFNYPK